MTVGHGTLAEADFARLLAGAGVSSVVDVRSYPGSRRHPQFGREAMERWLPEWGLAYRWVPALGGRRRPAPSSRNVALRHPAFRAYADHMATGEFTAALEAVVAAAADAAVATGGGPTVMCAESLWWRCHRRLLADAAMLLHGTEVMDLFHDGRLSAHRPAEEARVDESGVVVYDVGTEQGLPLG